MLGGVQEHSSDIILLKIHHHGLFAALELQKFVGLGILKAVDAHHAVADLQHRTHLGILGPKVDILKLGEQRGRGLGSLDSIFFHRYRK